MIIKNNFQIVNTTGFEIGINVYSQALEKPGDKFPIVIFSHGFKGFKDWGGFPYMMEILAEAGYTAASFNFSLNGVGKTNPMEFTRLDLFAQNTYSQELEDLECVIEYFYENADKYKIDRERIALIGHSRGGGISIIKAAEDKRIKYLITLAAVSHFNRHTTEYKKKWKERGFDEVLNSRTNQMMRMNASFIEDLENNKERLNILNSVKKLNIPYLLIHGQEDLSVKFSEAEEIYNYSNKDLTELYAVPNTGHTFGIVHPFEGTTKAFEMAISKTLKFLNNYL